jgi:pSer/pThr/pTyr-binding forkhead associated (FHA) protein
LFMILRYNAPNGEEQKFKLEKHKVTLGRGRDVDLAVHDRMASRLHCCIEFKNNGWHIKDLNSRNGTYVNGAQITETPLAVGDRILIGDMVLVCEEAAVKGTETVIRELKNEMDGGKGFKTMMMEIVGDGRKKDHKSHTDRIIP